MMRLRLLVARACMLCTVLFTCAALHAEGWRVESLGVPINAVTYGNSHGAIGPAPAGGTMVYTSYYQSTGAELVGYDFRTDRLTRKRLGSRGGYGVAVGQDGCIYTGGVSPGDLYKYDPRADALETINVKQFGVEYIWDIEAAPGGAIYCGAGYPKTNLVVYEPSSAQVRDLGEMVPGEQYLRSLCVDRQGRVWCGVGTHAHLIVYDPATGEKREVLPKEYAGNSMVYTLETVGDFVVAGVLYDGVLLVYDTARQQVTRRIPAPNGEKSWMVARGGSGETAYLYSLPSYDLYKLNLRNGEPVPLAKALGQILVVEADRWVHAINDQTYVVYDLKDSRTVASKRLTEGGDGMDVFALTAGPRGNIYGSTYINMHMFRCDAETGALTDLGKVSRWPGQVDSLSLGSDGRIYIGSYTDAVVCVYDPAVAWRPGLGADANPREIGPVGKGQYRTRANCLGPDGRVYVGSIPSYNTAEVGAFTICEPKSGKMDVRTDFVKAGAVHALVADERYVYGAGGGEFFVYDPQADKKRFTQERAVTALACIRGARTVGSGAGKIFVYERETNTISVEQENPAGDFTHMAVGPDGAAYGVNAKHVARVRGDGTVETLTQEGGKYAAVDRMGRVYFARGPQLLRCAPPPASQPAPQVQ